ncbi:MAG: hypothetical protein AAFQ82_27595, partial [Myxococcota bacterium]
MRVIARTALCFLACSFALVSACAAPIQHGRTSIVDMPSERETQAAQRFQERRCSPALGLAFPGLGHYCLKKPAEAWSLGALGAAELGLAAYSVERFGGSDTRSLLALVAFQNTYIVGIVDPLLERQRATRALYAPQDSLDELLLAPFNPEVLSKPDVWIGILVTTATQGLFLALSDSFANARGQNVNVLGAQLRPALGYPAAGVALAGVFEHVAVGEEV